MIVLDTHAWVWWACGNSHLSALARRRIASARARGVAAISQWEVCMLVAKGRLILDRDPEDWIQQALALDGVELLPLTGAVASRATTLGSSFHADPADQLIVATALVHGAQLVTRDSRIADWNGIQTIW